MTDDRFTDDTFSEAFVQRLRTMNPWWEGQPMPLLPAMKRWLFDDTLQRLKAGLAPITALRGPRQVGKTTLQEQIIDHLLHVDKINPARIFRVQFDAIPSLKALSSDQILTLCSWFERQILGKTFNQAARDGQPAYLFFDEVQNLSNWAVELKWLVDHNSVRVFITGSSALRIEYGRDSLAGRITTLEMGTLLLREIAALRQLGDLPTFLPVVNGLGVLKQRAFWENLRQTGQQQTVRDAAYAAFSARGGYPIAHQPTQPSWEILADQLNETVIRRVIQHDLRIGEKGRKRDQRLLEALFRLSCRYAGQTPSLTRFVEELQQTQGASIGLKRVEPYMRFLNDTLLIRLIEPLELRLKQRKGAAKICLCDHALRASWLQEVVPLVPAELQQYPDLTHLADHLTESIVGYFLCSIHGLDVAWFPQRATEPEIDFVLTVGEQRIPCEVKYRRKIEAKDFVGLQAFLDKKAYNAPFGLLLSMTDEAYSPDPRIIVLPVSSFLLMR